MFVQRLNDPGLQVSNDMYEAALRDIMEHLMSDGKTMADFNLPQPPAAGPRENRLLYQERHGYDMEKMAATLARIPDLNVDQRRVFDTVTSSLEAYRAGTLMQVGSVLQLSSSIFAQIDLMFICCDIAYAALMHHVWTC